ncbi:MAG TPA: membrane dipeptidase [Bryobacteraceae bacterium]|nr:membrane dipeptidase [Bryobacteraceae bacterium]
MAGVNIPMIQSSDMTTRRHFMGSSVAALVQAAQTNPLIQASRDAALAVLKPSVKQLEHGLELHAQSLVVESYGFSPRSAIDGAAMRKAIEAGAGKQELDDLHTEFLLSRVANDPTQREEYLTAWKASGVTCVLQNAGEESSTPLRILKRLAYITHLTDMLRGHVARAAVPDDIEAAKKQDRHCLYLTGNGVPLAEEWNSVPEELAYVRLFFQLGIRMMHLTYNRRNVLGDGCAEPANGGLSDLGRAAIAEMNRVGIIVDVAHSGWQTSLEAAKASSKPMVASHSGAVEVHRHIRSKPDEVIRAIADTGGYVGVYSVMSFLGRSGDLNAMLDHIEYLVKRFGAQHVAIGTDLAYIPMSAAAEYKKMDPRPKARPSYEALWPPGALDNRSHPSLAWTNWPMFTVGMVQRGIPDAAIQQILGGNVMRVARAVWPA